MLTRKCYVLYHKKLKKFAASPTSQKAITTWVDDFSKARLWSRRSFVVQSLKHIKIDLEEVEILECEITLKAE
jgi:hypothetical protein